MNSNRFQLNRADIALWLQNLLVFEGPAIIIALNALSSGEDLRFATGLLAKSTYDLIIDLLRKFIAQNSK